MALGLTESQFWPQAGDAGSEPQLEDLDEPVSGG